MDIFHREQPPKNGANKRYCGFVSSVMKNALCRCHTGCHTVELMSCPSPEGDNVVSDFDSVVVSAIRSQAMEAKMRRKAGLATESFWYVFSPTTGKLFIAPKASSNQYKTKDDDGDEGEEFQSAASRFSVSSSAAVSMDEFVSAKTNFSWPSRFGWFEFQDLGRRNNIIQELCDCEGWPFGLCRKALMLPPLPKSPSESWSWRKYNAAKIVFK